MDDEAHSHDDRGILYGSIFIYRAHSDNDLGILYGSIFIYRAHSDNDLGILYGSIFIDRAHSDNDLGILYGSMFIYRAHSHNDLGILYGSIFIYRAHSHNDIGILYGSIFIYRAHSHNDIGILYGSIFIYRAHSHNDLGILYGSIFIYRAHSHNDLGILYGSIFIYRAHSHNDLGILYGSIFIYRAHSHNDIGILYGSIFIYRAHSYNDLSILYGSIFIYRAHSHNDLGILYGSIFIYRAHSHNDLEIVYVIEDPVPCCGVINRWEAYVLHNGTIYLDIWRPNNGTLELVGTHRLTTADSVGSVNVSVGVQYTVNTGDYIGWYSPLEEMVAYIPGNLTTEARRVTVFRLLESLHNLGVGLNWAMNMSQSTNTYAIKAIYGRNTAPMFVNLNYQIEIFPKLVNSRVIYTINATDSKPISNGTIIYTINATDPDISDTTITQLTYQMISSTELFSFDPITRQVKVVVVDLPYPFDTRCLTFEVKDICLNMDRKSFCILADILPPTVICKPQTSNITEITTGNIALTSLDVIDPINGVTCNLQINDDFHLRWEDNEYRIYVDANPGFRAATKDFYNVSVTCSNIKKSTTVNCTVQILPSEPPKFTNLPSTLQLSSGNAISEIVYHVSVTDLDSKIFNFSMSCRPSPCPFIIYNTGYIQLTQYIIDLSASVYELNITVTDGYNSNSSVLTVIISGVNVSPIILPSPQKLPVLVPENTARGSVIYRVSATDSDGDALTYSMTAFATTGTRYFSIDRTVGFISTSSVNLIDFETISDRNFTLTVSVTDGRLTVSENFSIIITDVNEPPSFNQSVYKISANEGMADTTLPNPGFYVHDVDDNDTHTFEHDCVPQNSYFIMNDTNGMLTFAGDYDLDIPGRPRLITCNVKVIDKGNLSATATLSITINEINDNTPTFNNSSYTFVVYNDSVFGKVIGHISATDADIGTDGQFFYSTNQTGLAQRYFSVSPTGYVTLEVSLSREHIGASLFFIVYAIDAGSPARTGSASVTVTVLEPPMTTASPTTHSYKTFIEDKRNVVWIVFTAVLVFLTALVTLWVCWTSIMNWPIGFYPFRECARNYSRPRWCKDSRKDIGKRTNRPRQVLRRPERPQPVERISKLPMTPMQPSVTPPMSPDITLPVSFTPSLASRSPMRPSGSNKSKWSNRVYYDVIWRILEGYTTISVKTSLLHFQNV
ncbi:hypothetical protein ACJMK2_006565 [Sinanodonta woodiana]|uniref:Cadherin domain-containing protein n=1 Tax=Sinanodonta woodiana TaxID=1069815 RepID=A0ABD3VTJ5_SINWO